MRPGVPDEGCCVGSMVGRAGRGAGGTVVVRLITLWTGVTGGWSGERYRGRSAGLGEERGERMCD